MEYAWLGVLGRIKRYLESAQVGRSEIRGQTEIWGLACFAHHFGSIAMGIYE